MRSMADLKWLQAGRYQRYAIYITLDYVLVFTDSLSRWSPHAN